MRHDTARTAPPPRAYCGSFIALQGADACGFGDGLWRMPISTCRTIALDPRGVNRAFLCTFIRLWSFSNLSFLRPDGQPN